MTKEEIAKYIILELGNSLRTKKEEVQRLRRKLRKEKEQTK